MSLSNLTAVSAWTDKAALTPDAMNLRLSQVTNQITQVNNDSTFTNYLSLQSVFAVNPTNSMAEIRTSASSATLAGGQLLFLPGVYTSFSNLTIDGPCDIRGYGEVWLTAPAAASGTILRINSAPSTASVPRVRVQGIGFDGNASATLGKGIDAEFVHDFTVKDCRFRNLKATAITNSAYGIYCSGSTSSAPASPFPWTSFSTSPTGWNTGVRIENCTFSDSTGGDGVFFYYTDGAVVQDSFFDGCGRAVTGYGWCRAITVQGNNVQNMSDNGIRFEADASILSTDPRDIEGITMAGNVVRNSGRDGIRWSGNRGTCVGNTSLNNTLSGIAALVAIDSTIADNVCAGNRNHGIQLTQSTVTTWDTHRRVVIQGNTCRSNSGRGIIVQGGGPRATITGSQGTAASSVQVLNNSASFNSLDGVAMFDCEETCVVRGNNCESNGSVGVQQGILVTNDVMRIGMGGFEVSWNHCWDSRASAQAFQAVGIALSTTTATSVISGLRLYFNDLSGTTSNVTTAAQGIVLNLGNGTNKSSVLVGNRFDRVNTPTTLNSGDTEVYRMGDPTEAFAPRSGISVGSATNSGTMIPAISSTSSLVAAFVVQGSASSFTIIQWPAAKPYDHIFVTPGTTATVSSLSSGLVAHSHCTQAGQIEFRLSNVSTLAQNQSTRTWFFTRISPF